MISAPSVGIAFAPKPPPAAAVGSYRARKVRCAVAVAPAPAPAGTLYDVLGLRAGATVREIKAAYRRSRGSGTRRGCQRRGRRLRQAPRRLRHALRPRQPRATTATSSPSPPWRAARTTGRWRLPPPRRAGTAAAHAAPGRPTSAGSAHTRFLSLHGHGRSPHKFLVTVITHACLCKKK